MLRREGSRHATAQSRKGTLTLPFTSLATRAKETSTTTKTTASVTKSDTTSKVTLTNIKSSTEKTTEKNTLTATVPTTTTKAAKSTGGANEIGVPVLGLGVAVLLGLA